MTCSRPTAILAAFLSVAVAGCSQSTEPEGVTSSTTVMAASTTSAEFAVAVDGVSVTADTITIGVLADLTGPYSTGVVDVLDAQLAFWADLNERGGISGRQVEVLIEDTGYDTLTHVRAYHRLVDRVVMFSHSTGTEQTVAISDLLTTDHRVAIPLTWYSGWSVEPIGSNLIEIGSNYCIEGVNTISYLASVQDDPIELAVVTVPGDFGADSDAGVIGAAVSLGIEVAYDGAGVLGPDADLVGIARSIAASGADWTWLSADPSTAVQLVAIASQYGYSGGWTGSSPTWSTRLLATQLGPLLGEAVVIPSLMAPLGADVTGMQSVYETLAERLPERYPSEALVIGYLEFAATRSVLVEALEQRDLTPEGVERVAKQMTGSGFDGISPAADDNDRAVTATGISRFSFDTFSRQRGLEATLGAGAVTPIEPVAEFRSYGSDVSIDYSRVCPERG